MWGISGLNLNGMMKSSSSSSNNNNNNTNNNNASIEILTLNQLSTLQIKLKNHLPQIVPFSYKLSWPSHSSMLVLIFDWKRHRYIDRKKKYNKKDEKSSRQRKLNYRKIHRKQTNSIKDHSLWSTHL